MNGLQKNFGTGVRAKLAYKVDRYARKEESNEKRSAFQLTFSY